MVRSLNTTSFIRILMMPRVIWPLKLFAPILLGLMSRWWIMVSWSLVCRAHGMCGVSACIDWLVHSRAIVFNIWVCWVVDLLWGWAWPRRPRHLAHINRTWSSLLHTSCASTCWRSSFTRLPLHLPVRLRCALLILVITIVIRGWWRFGSSCLWLIFH